MSYLQFGVTDEVRTIQPYFVLSTGTTYYKKMIYNSPIAHFYSFVADCSDGLVFAVPDASIDILFLCDKTNPTVRLCGSTTSAKLVEIQAGKNYFGVRFRPGYIPRFIDMDSKTLIDAEFSLQQIDSNGEILLEKIVLVDDFARQVDYFLTHYQTKMSNKHSPISDQIRELISKYNGDIRISEMGQYIGYSSRYITKVFTEHLGLSPKEYALILRFQYILQRLTLGQQLNLTRLALEQGYADQSHFLREFKRFAAQTPSKFVQTIKTNNYQGRLSVDDTGVVS